MRLGFEVCAVVYTCLFVHVPMVIEYYEKFYPDGLAEEINFTPNNSVYTTYLQMTFLTILQHDGLLLCTLCVCKTLNQILSVYIGLEVSLIV